MPVEPGQTLGRYRITAILGSGGMGDVFRAHDSRLDRDVAIKLLKPGLASGDASALLKAEARAVSALSHPNVCVLHELDEVDGQSFLVMELVEGQTLLSLIDSQSLPVDRALRYATQVAAALAHAHQRGVVHRDLKTANAIVTPDGVVKVLDFGIARRADHAIADEATKSIAPIESLGVIAGTLPYMAPEVILGGPADARSDIWALGVMLVELVSGRRPFAGKTAFDLTSAIVHSPPELPGHIPTGVRAIVERCLKKSPGERYQSAAEVAAALDAVMTASATPARRRLTPAIVGAIAIAVVVAGVVAWTRWGGTPSAAAIDSLVVLPFADLTPRPESEYLADGITDAVITELGQLGALRVTSRTSSMRYRDSKKSMQEIARELGVDGVLEGSLFRDAGRVRVTARLVRAATETSLWTGTYERDLQNILALQRDLAQTVAGELRLSLTPDQTSRLANRQTVRPEAVEAYLKGRYQWAKRTPAALLSSIELFESAIRADPTYAAPHAGLANSYVLLSLGGIVERSSTESLRQAKFEAQRALVLDPRTPEAHTALGYAQLWSWELAESDRTFLRAIDLNPSDATTRFWHSVRLAAEGRFDESIAEAKRGQQLDPASAIVTAGLSWSYHLAGRHVEAEEHARRVMEIEPDFIMGLVRLGVAHKHQRAYGRAIETLQRAVNLSGRNPDILAQVGQTYGLQGSSREARAILDELNTSAKARYVPAFDRALIYAGLGDRDQAFDWLQRAYDERYSLLVLLQVDPDLNPLRDDPRFEALVRRVGSTPAR
jgi:eukaryotic-like serine/threonine-protein kinase